MRFGYGHLTNGFSFNSTKIKRASKPSLGGRNPPLVAPQSASLVCETWANWVHSPWSRWVP